MKASWKMSSKVMGWVLAACAALGLVASFTLLHESFQLAKNPSYNPPCNISVFISCQGAMASENAELFFGLPNPAIGIATYTALLVFAVLLLSGATFKPWVWVAGIGAALFGLGLTAFFYFESVLSLGTVCPWCASTWLATVGAFWAVVTHSLAAKRFPVPKRFQKLAAGWVTYAELILAATLAAMVFGILFRFSEALFA